MSKKIFGRGRKRIIPGQDTEIITLRVPAGLLTKIENAAEGYGIDRSDLIRRVLASFVKKRQANR